MVNPLDAEPSPLTLRPPMEMLVFGTSCFAVVFATLTCGASLAFSAWLWAWCNQCDGGDQAMNQRTLTLYNPKP